MYFNLFGRRVSVYVLVGALVITTILFGIVLLLMLLSNPARLPAGVPTAVFTVIAAPTSTLGPLPGAQATTTATPQSLIVNGISVGTYVQITDTEGAGLRLRSGPGTDFPPRFLGRESEVFEVKDGPRDANGFTWWYLVTPMDESRSGWAASEWLGVVSQPTPAP
jgi:hypothetical protein